MITEELEMIVCPSDAVKVVGCSPLGPEEVVVLGVLGKNVKVSPSVVTVVGAVIDGTVIVFVPPMIMTPELETTTSPSD